MKTYGILFLIILISSCSGGKSSNSSRGGSITSSTNSATLTITDTGVDYGNVTVGDNLEKVFTITNITTNSTATFSTPDTASLSLSDPYSLSTTTCSTSLSSNATCTITIKFTPTSAVGSDDTIVFSYNSGSSETTVEKSITGTGEANPFLTISDENFSFATLLINNSSVKTFTITNTGLANANLGTISSAALGLSAPFTHSGGTCTTSDILTASGGSCTINITFNPTSVGSYNESIDVSYDSYQSQRAIIGSALNATVPEGPWNRQLNCASSSSINISTNGPSYILVSVTGERCSGTSDQAVTSMTATGLTFTKLSGGVDSGYPDTNVEFWGATSSSALANVPVSTLFNNNANVGISILSLQGINTTSPLGNTVETTAMSDNLSATFTTNAGSQIFATGFSKDYNTATPTPDANTALFAKIGVSQHLRSYFPSPGGSTTISSTGWGGGDTIVYSAIELKAEPPVLQLHMDEASWDTSSDNIIDSSGNGFHGTSNDASITTTSDSKVSRAGSFNGSGCVVVPDNSVLHPTTALTMMTWVKTSELTNTPGIISKRTAATQDVAYSLSMGDLGGGFKFVVDIEDEDNRFQSNTILLADTWYHVAVVYDGSQSAANRVTLYINGQIDKVATETASSISNYSSDIHIGCLPGGGTTLNGKLDEVQILHRVFSAQEIYNIYNQ